MAVQARWYTKIFEISPKRITAITGFTTTYALNTDTNDDTSGTTKSNTRGRKPEETSFAVKYLAAAGATPRTEFTSWRGLVGKKDYLYIGGVQYGAHKFELTSADVSDVILSDTGATLQAVVTLTFKEDMTSPSTNTISSSGSKVQAKSAKPSTIDKELKSPYGAAR